MQNPEEFNWLLSHIKDCKSILEIGSFDGSSLRKFAIDRPGALLRAIDLDKYHIAGRLETTLDLLNYCGYDAKGILGNSHTPEVLNWAKQWAPYDFVFIDGDHLDPGITQDWEDYGPLGKIVGFHDIKGQDCDVPRLWRILKETYKTSEFNVDYKTPIYGYMGIGLIYNV